MFSENLTAGPWDSQVVANFPLDFYPAQHISGTYIVILSLW